MHLAIHWFRRDLRLTDNTALNAAVKDCEQVLPVYILSEWSGSHPWTGPARQEFLSGCLRELAETLQRCGSRLVFRRGREQDEVLEQLVRETGAEAIYFNNDSDPHGRMMEERVRQMGARYGIAVRGFDDCTLHHPKDVLSGQGTPYKVFGAYSRAWHRLEKPVPGKKPKVISSPGDPTTLPVPTLDNWQLANTATILPPGETAARKRLNRFIEKRISAYADNRQLPASDGSSRISQDLRWGLLSIREVFNSAQEAANEGGQEQRRNAAVFLNELAWREFAFQILWHFPEVLDREFLPQFRELKWTPPSSHFEKWTRGETGFPIVDAGIREMLATGFMHNRVRMITAMFLCKDLHHSWRLGEQFFLQHLVDGEIANNNAGWQWCASVGTDAQPYFRIQNPWTQTLRHDPEGEYIRRWVSELSSVPPAKLGKPPGPGERLASNYPPPIVDHAAERDRALEMYRSAADRHKAAALRRSA